MREDENEICVLTWQGVLERQYRYEFDRWLRAQRHVRYLGGFLVCLFIGLIGQASEAAAGALRVRRHHIFPAAWCHAPSHQRATKDQARQLVGGVLASGEAAAHGIPTEPVLVISPVSMAHSEPATSPTPTSAPKRQ
jgi:hypothetical protein